MYGFGLIGPDTGLGQQYQPRASYDANALYQAALANPSSQFRAGRVGVRGGTATPAAPAQAPPPGMVYQTAQPSPAGPTPSGPTPSGPTGYQPRYDMNAIWQQAMADPMAQFRPGRVGVRGYGTFVPPSVGGSGGPAQAPAAPQMPSVGDFYTPHSPGDVQNLPTSTIGANFLGGYTTRRRD